MKSSEGATNLACVSEDLIIVPSCSWAPTSEKLAAAVLVTMPTSPLHHISDLVAATTSFHGLKMCLARYN